MTSWRILQGGIVVAWADSHDAIIQYALQYANEGSLVVQEKRDKRWDDCIEYIKPKEETT